MVPYSNGGGSFSGHSRAVDSLSKGWVVVIHTSNQCSDHLENALLAIEDQDIDPAQAQALALDQALAPVKDLVV